MRQRLSHTRPDLDAIAGLQHWVRNLPFPNRFEIVIVRSQQAARVSPGNLRHQLSIVTNSARDYEQLRQRHSLAQFFFTHRSHFTADVNEFTGRR